MATTKKKNVKKKKNSGKKKVVAKKTNVKKKNTVGTKKTTTKQPVKNAKNVVKKDEKSKNQKEGKEVKAKEKKNYFSLYFSKFRTFINCFNRKNLILMAIFLLILALLLLFPYGLTNYQSEASGKILDVPKFSKLKEECCMYNATFSSIRSAFSLKMDLKKVLSIYKKMNCDGKEYYYNEKEDFTVVEYGVKKKFIFNEFYLTYGKGNSCEMDTSFKSIEMLPDDYSIDDAKREGNYVIEGDKVFNKEAYSNFLTDVENKKTSTFRIVSTTESGDVLITDLKYLADGKYKVFYDGTRDRNGKNHSAIMAYVYDHIGVYKNKLYAYNGDKITKNMLKTDRVYFLINLD